MADKYDNFVSKFETDRHTHPPKVKRMTKPRAQQLTVQVTQPEIEKVPQPASQIDIQPEQIQEEYEDEAPLSEDEIDALDEQNASVSPQEKARQMLLNSNYLHDFIVNGRFVMPNFEDLATKLIQMYGPRDEAAQLHALWTFTGLILYVPYEHDRSHASKPVDGVKRTFGQWSNAVVIPWAEGANGILEMAIRICTNGLNVLRVGSRMYKSDSNAHWQLRDRKSLVKVRHETILQQVQFTVIGMLMKNQKPPIDLYQYLDYSAGPDFGLVNKYFASDQPTYSKLKPSQLMTTQMLHHEGVNYTHLTSTVLWNMQQYKAFPTGGSLMIEYASKSRTKPVVEVILPEML